MIFCWPSKSSRHKPILLFVMQGLVGLLFFGGLFFSPPLAQALVNNTPWTPEPSFQNLVYGGSSGPDVIRVMGEQPDQIVYGQQMYPVLENYYYYDKTGAATVFVFENGLLVGMHYKSPSNQMIDLTSLLTNNGDRRLNAPLLQGYQSYYPYFDLFYGTMENE